MKRRILVVIISVLTCFGVVFAEDNSKDNNVDYTAINEQLYISSLNEHFENYDSHVEYVAINQSIVENCSTEELMELMLSCPLLCNIRLFDSYEAGLDSLINDFNYFEEFMNREDAFEVALNTYADYEISANTILNYNTIVREETKNVDINMLSKDKNLAIYVLRDANVEYSVEMLETIIGRLAENRSVTTQELNNLASAIDDKYDQECHSEYYDYGRRLSRFVKNKETVLLKIGGGNGSVYASSGSGSNRYYVYTPSGYAVSATYSTSQTVNSVASCTQLATQYHATLYSVSVQEYNCHTYAWISQRPAYSSNYTHIWINSTSTLTSDSFYSHQNTVHAVGDIACNGNTHSAFVYALNQYNSSNGMYQTKYKSKWGYSGIFIHFWDGMPYYNGVNPVYYWH